MYKQTLITYNLTDMSLFVNTLNEMSEEQAEKLFAAGVTFMAGKAFSAAYSCFELITLKDFRLLYNKALCCFMVEWYDECYRIICEAERVLPGNVGAAIESLPEAFLRYRYDDEPPYCPMPHDTPIQLAYTQLLRLKAETAFKLHLHSEVKAISNRLGRKYKHIELLIKNLNNDEDE